MKILDEMITPKLNKLKEQKRAFNEFQRVEMELDETTRVLAAFEYFHHYVGSLLRECVTGSDFP